MKISKNEIDLDLLLVTIKIILKGYRQELVINTTALNGYSRTEKDKFGNKFYHFEDYKRKKTVSVNLSEVKCFSIPFFRDDNENEYNFQTLIINN